MKRSYKIIPIYTADVSGVCSALYELGGMTVMHDPSGCNSTYNTHDEIRWYDQDSMIYISGLTEIDAVMGNDEKLIRDIEIAAEELKPKFIALAGSPIPYMNGTDFEAIAKILEQDLGIPAFSVPTNGMHDYVYGVGRALAEIAKRIEGKREVTPKSASYNFNTGEFFFHKFDHCIIFRCRLYKFQQYTVFAVINDFCLECLCNLKTFHFIIF